MRGVMYRVELRIDFFTRVGQHRFAILKRLFEPVERHIGRRSGRRQSWRRGRHSRSRRSGAGSCFMSVRASAGRLAEA